MWITSVAEFRILAAQLRVRFDGQYAAVICLPQVDSTNSWVKQYFARTGDAKAIVVFTHNQDGGRGTRNRAWVMQPGLDIALSVGVRLPAGAGIDQRLSLAAGGVVAAALAKSTGAETKVKWPNDILLETNPAGPHHSLRKACGILLETSVAADRGKVLVIGVGVNANSLPGQYPPELRCSLTSLREVTGVRTDLTLLIESLAGTLLEVAQTQSGDSINDWLTEWFKRDATGGTRYLLNRGGVSRPVEARRVDRDSGRLVVADTAGAEYEVASYTELDYPSSPPAGDDC